MAKCIGIDLGTTNSVATIAKGSHSDILQNRENEDLTRSVISWYKSKSGNGQVLVGSPAVDIMVKAPKDTIISIKRLMGRAFSDPEVQKIRENFLYQIESPVDGTDDDLRVVMGGKRYSPIQISSMILKKIKEDTEERLKDTVDRAVITVPAYFTDKQRDATRRAGWLTGLKVQKILSEPTAAAIAYGVYNLKPEETKNILIYDLGGGTFDVSILTVAGGVFAELGIAGDMWLGGDDFDQMIIDHVIKSVEDEYGINFENIDEAKRLRFHLALKKEAERAKKSLSSTTRAQISLMGMLEDEEKNLIDVEVELTRDQFEQMIEPKVRLSIDIANQALENANIDKEHIDNVILVGGSSSIPMVQRALIDEFGEEKVLKNVDPMKCVAQGAGILAGMLNEIECPVCKTPNPIEKENCLKCGESLLGAGIVHAGITGMHYGIQTAGDVFDIIIPQGSPYPSPQPVIQTYETPVANMRRIKVPVHAGLDTVASKNERQCIVWLELPENVPQGTHVDVLFALDSDGVLEKVKVSLKDGSGREVEVYPDRGDDKRSKVEKMLDEAKKVFDQKRGEVDSQLHEEIERLYQEATTAANVKDIDKAEKKANEIIKKVNAIGKSDIPDCVRRANNIISWAEVMIQSYGWLIDPQKTYKVEKLVQELKDSLDKEDQTLTEQKIAELDDEINALPDIIMICMTILSKISQALDNGDYRNADLLKQKLHELEVSIKNNNVDAVNRLVDEMAIIIRDMAGARGEKPDVVFEDLLGKRKSSSGGH